MKKKNSEVFFGKFADKFLGFKNGVEFMYYAFTFNMYNNERKQAIYALENKKIFSKYNQYISRIKTLLKKKNYRRNSHYIFLGDSHILNYEYLFLNNYFSNFLTLFGRIQGASIYGLGNKKSETGTLNLIQKIFDKKQGQPNIFLNLGEVDCRATFWMIKKKKENKIDKIIDKAVINYANLIKWLKRRGYHNITLIGVQLPFWKESNIWTKKFTSKKNILIVTKKLNTKLKFIAKKLSCDYFDINKELINLTSKKKININVLEGEHHLNPEVVSNIYIKKIRGKS
jgi:hypothetical protein